MSEYFRSRWFRRWLLFAGFAAILGATAFGFVSVIGGIRHDRAILAWNARFGSWDNLLARYPPRDANEPALRIEERAARLGVNLAPESGGDRSRPSVEQERRFRRIEADLSRYVRSQIVRNRSPVASPSSRVADFLANHAAEIAAVRDELIEAPAPPAWELYLEREIDNPLPNLLGHFNLQRVLIADALEHTRIGDHETARRDLEASWRLNEVVRRDPVLITQSITISIARIQAGALRHIEGLDPVWQGRLLEQRFRRSMRHALQNEVRFWSMGSTALFDTDDNLLTRSVMAVAAPYIRLCLADVTEESLRQMDKLTWVEDVCDPSARGADESGFAGWNRLAPLIVPNFGGISEGIARLELDLELTTKVLEARAARDTLGAWPTELARARSETCPADLWVYEADPSGNASIRFHRDVNWADQSGTLLPVSFAIPPPLLAP